MQKAVDEYIYWQNRAQSTREKPIICSADEFIVKTVDFKRLKCAEKTVNVLGARSLIYNEIVTFFKS